MVRLKKIQYLAKPKKKNSDLLAVGPFSTRARKAGLTDRQEGGGEKEGDVRWGGRSMSARGGSKNPPPAAAQSALNWSSSCVPVRVCGFGDSGKERGPG